MNYGVEDILENNTEEFIDLVNEFFKRRK